MHFKQTVELNHRNHKHKQSDHDGMSLHQNTEKSHSNPSCTAMKQKPLPSHEKHHTKKMCPATMKIPTAIELHSSNQDTFNPRVPLLISSCSSQAYSLCHYQGTLKLQGLVVDLLIKKTEWTKQRLQWLAVRPHNAHEKKRITIYHLNSNILCLEK